MVEIRLRNKILREIGHLFPVGDIVLDPSTEQWLHLHIDVQNYSEKQLVHLEAVHRVVKEAFQLWGMGVEHHQMVCSSPNIKHLIGRHLGAA